MAVSRVATLTFDNGLGSSRTWQATAAVQDTAAGSSVTITTTAVSAGVAPPVTETAFTLNVYTETGVLVKAFTLTPGSASQSSTFFFTSTGDAGSARAGSYELSLRVQQTAGLAPTQYDYETNGATTALPTTFTATVVNRGWVRSTTTAVTTLAGAGLLAYPDTLTATTVLGAAPNVSKTVTVALTPLAATASAASATATFTTALGVTDNRFPLSVTTPASVTAFPVSGFTGQPWTTATITETTRSLDPRITLPLRAQKDVAGSLGAAADSTSFVIGADVGFMWVASSATSGAVNANGVKLSGLTVKQDLIAADTVTVVVTGTSTTDANGVTSRLDFTAGILPPAGNRTQKATVTAPAGATGNSNTRTIGFASAYTADRQWLIVAGDSLLPNTPNPIRARYVSTAGPVAPDAPPTVRVFQIAADGTDTVVLSTAMTSIGNSTFEAAWTPTTTGVYAVEVRGVVSQSAVEGTAHVTVRTLLFDGAGFVGFPSK